MKRSLRGRPHEGSDLGTQGGPSKSNSRTPNNIKAYANYVRESVLQPINLSIGTLNICGHKRRSVYPEFCDLVPKYDVFFVTETKQDHTDVISVDGYCFESKPRQVSNIRESGGIGVFINENF